MERDENSDLKELSRTSSLIVGFKPKSTPTKISSPEDEMKRFMEQRRKSIMVGQGTSRTLRGDSLSASMNAGTTHLPARRPGSPTLENTSNTSTRATIAFKDASSPQVSSKKEVPSYSK